MVSIVNIPSGARAQRAGGGEAQPAHRHPHHQCVGIHSRYTHTTIFMYVCLWNVNWVFTPHIHLL